MARKLMTADEMFEASAFVCPRGLDECGAVLFRGHVTELTANALLARSRWAPMWVLSPRQAWVRFDRHEAGCDEPCACLCDGLPHEDMGHAGEHDCDERCDEVCGCGSNMADYGLLGYVHPATPTTPEAVPVTVAGWADEDFEVPLEETYEAELFGWQAAADPERQAVTT